MTPAELGATIRLGGRVFSGVVSRVEQVHTVIARRAFGAVGDVGDPVRLVHGAVGHGVYGTVRGAGVATGAILAGVASRLRTNGEPMASTPGGNLVLAALNAVAGDRLGPDTAPLAIRMAVRANGRDVALLTEDLASAFPQATCRLAVFLHGLAETENSWRRGGTDCQPYGDRLRADFGYTPVYVRYNTGRHVSDNGSDLSALLVGLCSKWPDEVEEILLVGHSMGGLVIRSACHAGQQAGAAWVQRVSRVFCLGSPHLGAPVARAAGFAGLVMHQMPETRPFVTLVNGSSSGIKDLRYGYLVSRDWADCDPDSCLRDHRSDVPLLSGAEHYTISATVTADPDSPYGGLVGDLLVQPESAHGRRRGRQHIPFSSGSGRRLGGMHHFDLLNHPAVWAAIRGILDR